MVLLYLSFLFQTVKLFYITRSRSRNTSLNIQILNNKVVHRNKAFFSYI